MQPVMARPGLLRCGLYEDATRCGALLYLEEWGTLEDLNGELRSGRFTRLLGVMEAAASRPDLELRLVGDVHGLAYAAAIREEWKH